ncbi:MAG: sulfatase-like hydrolase/transferase [Cellvibrionales bacterium]|nr:sulfatase-like hydrolase/transferase [Cellvibrionales bacterium]
MKRWQKRSSPGFSGMPPPLPHAPLHAPPDANNAKIDTDDEKYAAMVAHLDRNVGELLGALENSGQRENTIVVFLSDNGAPEKRSGSNAGFSGGKAHYSEGAVRTPMVWVDPGFTMPGSLDERAVTIADVFPTLAARVGASLSFSVDGIDWDNLDNVKIISDRSCTGCRKGARRCYLETSCGAVLKNGFSGEKISSCCGLIHLQWMTAVAGDSGISGLFPVCRKDSGCGWKMYPEQKSNRIRPTG